MITNILILFLVFFFIFLAGQFDGFQTNIKDMKNETKLLRWILKIRDEKKRQKYLDWYYANSQNGNAPGNNSWNPSLPSIPFLNFWYGDAWHTMKFGWIYSYAIAISILVCHFITGWIYFPLWFIIFQGIEGQSFRLGYGIFWRINPKESVWGLLKDWNPFKNTH
ncbi:MAG: hypothetical protein ACYC25_01690 [Paludibacter sp.]